MGNSSEKNTIFEVYFSKFMETLNNLFGNEIKERISPQTCFVCLLHLANEKGKKRFINFRIKFRADQRK